MNKREVKAKKEIAEEHYKKWLEAELVVTTHQAYTIASRSLTRANLGEIRRQIEYWDKQISKLNNIINNGGRNRVYRVVPRDL